MQKEGIDTQHQRHCRVVAVGAPRIVGIDLYRVATDCGYFTMMKRIFSRHIKRYQVALSYMQYH
jgi:hypothetical protein